jgi:hypothetical protein
VHRPARCGPGRRAQRALVRGGQRAHHRLWQLETELVQGLRQACADQLQQLEQELQDAEGLVQRLREHRPPMPTR